MYVTIAFSEVCAPNQSLHIGVNAEIVFLLLGFIPAVLAFVSL